MEKKNRANVLVVDYGMGNIRSIQNALIRLGCLVRTSDRAEDILSADAIIRAREFWQYENGGGQIRS